MSDKKRIKPAYTTQRYGNGGIKKTLTPEGKRQAMEKLKEYKCQKSEA